MLPFCLRVRQAGGNCRHLSAKAAITNLREAAEGHAAVVLAIGSERLGCDLYKCDLGQRMALPEVGRNLRIMTFSVSLMGLDFCAIVLVCERFGLAISAPLKGLVFDFGDGS